MRLTRTTVCLLKTRFVLSQLMFAALTYRLQTHAVLLSFIRTLRISMRTLAGLQLEILALQHQLRVLQRTRPHRVSPPRTDRLLWVW